MPIPSNSMGRQSCTPTLPQLTAKESGSFSNAYSGKAQGLVLNWQVNLPGTLRSPLAIAVRSGDTLVPSVQVLVGLLVEPPGWFCEFRLPIKSVTLAVWTYSV